MAAELGQAYVQIIPSAQGVAGKITDAISPGASTAGEKAGERLSKSMGSKISSLGGKFIKVGALSAAISAPIIAGISSALKAYETQNLAEEKLIEIYKTRMGVSKDAAQSTMDLASSLQKQGIIGDEVALSGAQQLATFARYPSTINTLLPAMNNLLAQQKGVNATADDAVNIGNLMGKVLNGQTGALKRVGISFTDAQEDVLKYGTEEEKAAMLAEVINQNVGNMNETLANTPAGKMAQLKNSLGDIQEELGAALAPVVAKLAEFVSEKVVPMIEKMVKFVQEHPMIAKITVAIAALLVVGGTLLVMIGTLMTAVAAISAPVLAVVAAIAAAIAIGVLLYKNWDTIKKKASEIWNAVKKVISDKIDSIKKTFKAFADAIKTIVPNAWKALKEKTSEAWKKIKTAITKPFTEAKEKIKDIIDKIKGFLDFDFELPHIKLPHFSIDPPGWSVGDLLKGVIPGLGIEWYAKGGIFNAPTIAGLGDDGEEAAVPLDPFWKRMDRIVDAVEADKDRPSDQITINVYAQPGMDIKQLASEVERRMVMLQKQRERVYA